MSRTTGQISGAEGGEERDGRYLRDRRRIAFILLANLHFTYLASDGLRKVARLQREVVRDIENIAAEPRNIARFSICLDI